MSHQSKDFYKVLQVPRTASRHEIKQAYRKLALALHPDRNDGCTNKADEFKTLNQAYDTLSNHRKRTAYDDVLHGGRHRSASSTKRRPPPPNYRKVYSPRAPPGFKTFDERRHFDMHYGDGMMREEIERARKRAEAASTRNTGYEYESPLGKGFTFEGAGGGPYTNPYSRRSPQGPNGQRSGGFEIEYEEAHYYDMNSSDLNNAKRVVRAKERVVDRMQERRKNRRERQPRQERGRQEEESGCVVM